jgi:hypothetical protein
VPDGVAPEEIALERFLPSVTSALLAASRQLDAQNDLDAPYRYVIPEMSVTVQLTMSYSSGKVTGIFSKSQTNANQTMQSSVTLRVVATPRQ